MYYLFDSTKLRFNRISTFRVIVKELLLVLFGFSFCFILFSRKEKVIIKERTKVIKIVNKSIDNVIDNAIDVTATMYYAVKGQCDKDPLTTAGMFKIIPHKASEQKLIALSRDLLKRWGGSLNYGDKVMLLNAGHKSGVYVVADTMNKRFKRKIDILETKGTPLYKFENVKIIKV
jgi:3D (Asp-Asp-Asp) domain-containing protein